MTAMDMMKAVVLRHPGGPEVLCVEEVPKPRPQPGEVCIRVKAFGLNRSELFTRQGHSADVHLPRIPGIEAVGIVEEAPNGTFRPGDVVATAIGGMGRDFDGGYAEFTCVPAVQVQAVTTTLDWAILGALPEMLQTAWGSLFKSLELESGDHLLIRGATTSVGLAAIALARSKGAFVTATTRSLAREALLRSCGADDVIIDSGLIASEVERLRPGMFDKILEMIGPVTLADSLQCARQGGVVCMTGIVGDRWTYDQFTPMEVIPTAVRLTTYGGRSADFMRLPLQELVGDIEEGRLAVKVGPIFRLDQIAEAHRCMESNSALGKIVVLTS